MTKGKFTLKPGPMHIRPITPAPVQLDLFGMVADQRYVNLVPLYEAMPRFVPGS